MGRCNVALSVSGLGFGDQGLALLDLVPFPAVDGWSICGVVNTKP